MTRNRKKAATQRTASLQHKEALEQQAATAEILRVISASPTDVQPVFDSIARSARQLLNGRYAVVVRKAGDMLELVAHTLTARADVASLEALFPVKMTGQGATGQAVLTGKPAWIADVEKHPAYSASFRAAARARGFRSQLTVPILSKGESIGAISVTRPEPGAFAGDQIRLLQTFAEQAAIAIENVRLFNETREALERQTATAEILKVIASSQMDVQPVFDSIVQSCLSLFDGMNVAMFLVRGEQLDRVAFKLAADATDEAADLFPLPLSDATVNGQVILTGRSANVADILTDSRASERSREVARRMGYRSLLAVPLLREGKAIGSIAVFRRKPERFADQQIALLQTFANQAVIAIENARLFNETKEALERQTATADILKVISRSQTDEKPVFDAIVATAAHLFGRSGRIRLVEGGELHLRARSDVGRVEASRDAPIVVNRDSLGGRVVLERTALQIADTLAPDAPPFAPALGARGGYRAMAAAPLLRDGAVLGVVSVTSPQPGALSDKEMALLQTFADQAVIAIENARLFKETNEALERQTASSEVLRVISGTPADAQPVFDAIAQSALRVFQVAHVGVNVVDGSIIKVKATAGSLDPRGEVTIPLDRNSTAGRSVLDRALFKVEDTEAPDAAPFTRDSGRLVGFRAIATAPMMREGVAVGSVSMMRKEPGAFSDKQLELLQTFADQAAIAIENARLFNETREALERQTATSEILQVISSSPTDEQPVLDAIVQSAVRLFPPCDAVIVMRQGNMLDRRARAGPTKIDAAVLAKLFPAPYNPGNPGSPMSRCIETRSVVEIEDVLANGSELARKIAAAGKLRSATFIPLLREDEAIGLISIQNAQPGFRLNEKQLALAQTFAAQAVIAIENVRLFNETRESLERQTATAEILKVISRFDTDLQPVFDAIAANALRLCQATTGWVYRFDGELIHIASAHGLRAEAVEVLRQDYPMRPGRGAATARAILTSSIVCLPDVRADQEYTLRDLAGAAAYLSVLSVPMLLEGKPIGAITVTGAQAGAFTERQIGLLQTFAEQAVIAIQNAHLFAEIREKSSQLEIANKHKSEFLANMSHELRTPLNAIIGFSEVLSDRMFGEVNEKQLEYLKDIHESGRHLLSLINDILDLSKIEAGRMDLDLTSFDLPGALSNAMTLIRERAQRHGIALGLEVDRELGEFQGDERKFKQIMLNLLSNAVKFTPDGGKVDVSAKRLNGKVEVAVRDTGIGIAPEDQAAVFEEFKQVGRDRMRKAEGTGLGLALTKRFVELHGGAIRLESTPGKGSTFTVELPLQH